MIFMKSLFARDGDYFIPDEIAASVWSSKTIHGGVSSALMVAQMEDRFSSDDMQLSRLTVDLFRPVPMAPLRVFCKTVRDGKRIKIFDVSLVNEDVEVGRASGLILQKNAIEIPEYVQNDVTLPEEIERAFDQKEVVGLGGIKRMIKGGAITGLRALILLKPVFLNIGVGHGCSWVKLPVNVIEGRENSPLLNVTVLADFANGFSQVRLSDEMGYINADLTINLFRMPQSEWLCVDATAYPQTNGLAMVETVLYDERGTIGRVSQSNLVQRRFVAKEPLINSG
jgi:hypothetical protein